MDRPAVQRSWRNLALAGFGADTRIILANPAAGAKPTTRNDACPIAALSITATGRTIWPVPHPACVSPANRRLARILRRQAVIRTGALPCLSPLSPLLPFPLWFCLARQFAARDRIGGPEHPGDHPQQTASDRAAGPKLPNVYCKKVESLAHHQFSHAVAEQGVSPPNSTPLGQFAVRSHQVNSSGTQRDEYRNWGAPQSCGAQQGDATPEIGVASHAADWNSERSCRAVTADRARS
jgi:hypothetical protein